MQNNPEQAGDTVTDLTLEMELAPYLETYQLKQPPFKSDIAWHSIFLDADREQQLNHLLHLVQTSDLILVVAGEPGSGKTMLAREFIHKAGPGLRCCPITASPGLSEQDLLTRLATCLDLPDKLNKPAILELLWDQAFTLKRNDLTPVILVDDAQNLPAPTLALLLQLQTISTIKEEGNDSPWRIILFTNPAYTAELMQLKSRLHFIHLATLDEQQTGEYLLHRMRAAGLTQTSPFSAKDIAFIHKHAQGNLHQVHHLAHQLLLEKHTRTNKPMEITKPQMPRLKIKPGVWIPAIAVIILSVILFFQDKINKLVETDGSKNRPLTQQTLTLPEPQEFILKKIDDPKPAQVDLTTKPASQAAEKPVVAIAPPEQSTAETEVNAPEKEIAAEKPQPLKVSPDEKTAIPPAQPVVKKSAAVKSTSSSSVALDKMLEQHKIHGKAWILKQPPTSLTAQMMASTRPDALVRGAKNPAFAGNTAIYHILRNNKDWYVLVYGSYSSKVSMKKSLEQLPATLQKGKPWIRFFKAVQAEINAGSK